jgi:hypothetical protein
VAVIATAVVAHVKREAQAQALAARLGAQTFTDDGTLGEWLNHSRALAWAADHGTHALVLQDDALPIPEFAECVRQAIEHKPEDMIGLYVGRQRPMRERVEKAVAKADEVGASWLTCERLCWGVATIIPTHAIAALLGYLSTAPYDRRIGMAWREHTGRDVVFTWPSLVDHADGETVIKGRAQRVPGRVAHRVGVPSWADVSVAV